jgi:hypothetical protein
MNFKYILAILFIFACTTFGWFILGTALVVRTSDRSSSLGGEVGQGWGPPLAQHHPEAWFLSPGGIRSETSSPPRSGKVHAALRFEPKKRGLMWYRTFQIDFSGRYEIHNPSPVEQTIYVRFRLPSEVGSFENFSFSLGGRVSEKSPHEGMLVEAVTLPPGGLAELAVTYRTRGLDQWTYQFGDNARVRNFSLQMQTDFAEIDFPPGTGSPNTRKKTGNGWNLGWEYADVLAAPAIGMAMPSVRNAGPVAARISFFAPVGLLFFFAVVGILGSLQSRALHPMNYFFLAAGFFAFQLLFAYLVDLLPLIWSFLIAAAVSLTLIGTYVHAVSRGSLTRLVVTAQLAFMALFSYSFFFEGITGLTIAIGAVATLALLMHRTARIDWAAVMNKKNA